jgi:ubiquinone/menaquinone biosynthesis C-methylase UbiE
MASQHATESYKMYNARAPTYDAGNGGWHVELGLDFVEWIKPKPGDVALDLACGTGLVTLPLASAIGSSGKVIAVDLSPGMLAEAKKKPVGEKSAPINWIEGDITSLVTVPRIQAILRDHGGFNIITLCSALALLPDQPGAMKQLATLLQPGGRMIIDAPTENKTLQNLFFVDLRQAVGLGLPYIRDWIKNVHTLEKLYEDAGLEVEKSWRTRSYLPEKWYEADQAMDVFDEQTSQNYTFFAKEGKLDEARKLWPAMWTQNLTNGKFWDGHALYVTIGRKPHI